MSASTRTEPTTKTRRRRRRVTYSLSEFLWIAPAAAFVIFFTFFAAVFAVRISFYDYSLASVVRPFVGLGNYIQLWNDSAYWHSMGLSFLFAAIDVPLTILIGFILALMLNQPLAGRSVFRSALLLPWVISMVIAGYMLKWIFSDSAGILNYFLTELGFGRVRWLSTAWGAFSTIAISHAWKAYPFGMVILLAGLQGIPKDLYEVAEIDGANAFQRLINITIPFLVPQFLILFILRTLNSFNMVDIIFAMTQGGPGNATEFVSFYMYQRAFAYLDLGYATAIAVTILVVNIVLALVYLRVLRSRTT
jgi:multiple sugar transport system permease protein